MLPCHHFPFSSFLARPTALLVSPCPLSSRLRVSSPSSLHPAPPLPILMRTSTASHDTNQLTLRVLSWEQVARRLSSGAQHTKQTQPEWPFRDRRCLRADDGVGRAAEVSTSHMEAVQSLLALARYRPLGLNTRCQTSSVCCRRHCKTRPARRDGRLGRDLSGASCRGSASRKAGGRRKGGRRGRKRGRKRGAERGGEGYQVGARRGRTSGVNETLRRGGNGDEIRRETELQRHRWLWLHGAEGGGTDGG